MVAKWTEERSTLEVVTALGAGKVPCSPIREIDQVMDWPHLQERRMVDRVFNPLAQSFVKGLAPGFPLKFSRTPGGYDAPPPRPGEHTKTADRMVVSADHADVFARNPARRLLNSTFQFPR